MMVTEREEAACLGNADIVPAINSFLSGHYTVFKRESQILAFRIIVQPSMLWQ